MAEFSERFKQLRSANGYSQQELADLLNVSKSTVNMYERGERKPGIAQLEAVADFFNVDMDYLSGKSDIPRKSIFINEQIPSSCFDNYEDEEKNLIKKYRKLDTYGKKAVNLILDSELERCNGQNTIKSFQAASSVDNHEPEIDISEYTQNIAAGTGEEGFTDKKINEVNEFAEQIYKLENPD